ncbi:peptidase S10, serine carboxypeptidase, alpha/beta hydrolase fold protein [Tanacetum coccineum]
MTIIYSHPSPAATTTTNPFGHGGFVVEEIGVFVEMNGDHDMVFPYVGIQKWIKSLNVPIASPWKPWFLRSQVGGYQTTYERNGYSLKHATIKGAGHVVVLTKPEEALSMVSEWLGSHTYSSAS